jgi:purine nucleosidase
MIREAHMPKKIIIDTDPGIDDAMAILMALRSPELEVVGLTSVFGNTRVELTSQNALRILEVERHAEIPVYQGAGTPLVKPRGKMGTQVHGEDGLGDIGLPPPRGHMQAGHAAEFIIAQILAHPGEITLATIGPLTNLALALRLEPRIAGMVREVALMGGSLHAGGNVSPVAEANIAADPHAAQIVFSAGWPLTMVGLDVTHRTLMTAEMLEALERAHTPATDFMTKILPIYRRFHHEAYGMGSAIHTHDPSVIAYLIDPSLYQTQRLPVFVETEGRCAGQTVPDPHHQWSDAPQVTVCTNVDAPRVLALIIERLSS